MAYGWLADLVVVLHFAFVLFAALGGILALRWRWIPWVHLPAVAWGAFVELTDRICPLTPLENRLRLAAGRPAYDVDFIERWIAPVLYPTHLTRDLQLTFAAVLVVINIAVYAAVLRRRANRGNGSGT